MYARRARGSSQATIQNLSGYVRGGAGPRGVISLRGLGRMKPEPEGGCRQYDAKGNCIAANPGNPFKPEVPYVPPPVSVDNSVVTQNTDPAPNYVMPPVGALPPAIASTATASASATTSSFSLSDVPWWGWAIAAFGAYSLLGGTSPAQPARRGRR